MAKRNKESVESIDGSAGNNQAEVETSQLGLPEGKEPEPKKESTGIETEDDARSHVLSKYNVPTESKIVFVTSDRNVFWQTSASSAVNHAQKNNLKLFRLQWQD